MRPYAAALEQFDKVLPVWRRAGYPGSESSALQLSGQAHLSLGEPRDCINGVALKFEPK